MEDFVIRPKLLLGQLAGEAYVAALVRFPDELEPKEGAKPITTAPEMQVASPDAGNITVRTGAYSQFVGRLGLPVFTYAILKYGQKSITLLDVVIKVSRAKRIIKTALAQRKGSVKESFGLEDMAISITGGIANDVQSASANKYPESEAKKLWDMCEIQDALSIESPYLNRVFGVKAIVIESATFDELKGMVNVQKFTLQCSDSQPVVLNIKK